jgi:hypothetical protein
MLFFLKELTQSVFERGLVVSINTDVGRSCKKGCAVFVKVEGRRNMVVLGRGYLVIYFERDLHRIVVRLIESWALSKCFLQLLLQFYLHFDVYLDLNKRIADQW